MFSNSPVALEIVLDDVQSMTKERKSILSSRYHSLVAARVHLPYMMVHGEHVIRSTL